MTHGLNPPHPPFTHNFWDFLYNYVQHKVSLKWLEKK